MAKGLAEEAEAFRFEVSDLREELKQVKKEREEFMSAAEEMEQLKDHLE